jgi:hypothetical protein
MENLQTLFLCKMADIKNKAPWSLQPGGFVVGDGGLLINQLSGRSVPCNNLSSPGPSWDQSPW